jgi:hypothetical protein
MPDVTHGLTDFGKPAYGGPCPPEGSARVTRIPIQCIVRGVSRLPAGAGDSARQWRNLPKKCVRVLQRAKVELRSLYQRPRRA